MPKFLRFGGRYVPSHSNYIEPAAIHDATIVPSLVPRPSSLVGKNKGEEGLVKLITSRSSSK